MYIHEWFGKLFSTDISTKILSDDRKAGIDESRISVNPENVRQGIIIGYCLVIFFASLYVPWKVMKYNDNGILINLSLGYSFIFSSPMPSVASIDYGLIILEIIATTAIAIILYVLKNRLSILINRIIDLNRQY